jgi:hypothetical protein
LLYRYIQIIALLFLTSVFTAAAIHFDFFPGPVFVESFKGLDAVIKQRRQLDLDFNAGSIYPSKHNLRGVTRFDRTLTEPGYTLYSSGESRSVKLIDFEGNVLHQWDISYADLSDPDDVVQQTVPERFIFVRKARMLPNGDLITILSSWGTTPYGTAIVKVDKNSNLIWNDFRHIHHSFDQAEDGTIYALDQEVVTTPAPRYAKLGAPYLDDGVAIYSADGQFIKRFSLLDTIYNAEYPSLITAIVAETKKVHGNGDVLHSNDIEILRSDKAALFPFAKAGDLLISCTKINGIAIVDPETELMTWFTTGYWRHQHDPDFLDNGNIMLFDNKVMRADANGRKASRVVEFDPKTMEIQWEYPGMTNEYLNSGVRAAQERLSNGNTLITESAGGRILEVTSDGRVAWEFYHPVRLGEKDDYLPSVFWAKRYSPAEIEFKLSYPE